jgi:hypothetical protein
MEEMLLHYRPMRGITKRKYYFIQTAVLTPDRLYRATIHPLYPGHTLFFNPNISSGLVF